MKLSIAWTVIIGALLVGCGALNKWVGVKDDHEAEELSEVVIEHYSGINVDLSPASPEENSECKCQTKDDS